jgi:hypothetical protein
MFGMVSMQESLQLALDGRDNQDQKVREEVMEDIQKFLRISYSFGLNPVSGLREVFPGYRLQFYSTDFDYAKLRRLIMTSDFIWLADELAPLLGDDVSFVTATKLDRGTNSCTKPLNMFWAGKDKGIWDFAHSLGGTPIRWDN